MPASSGMIVRCVRAGLGWAVRLRPLVRKWDC